MDNCIAAKNTVNRLYILLFKHQTTVVSKYQNQPWNNCINFISLTFNVIRYQYNTAFFNIYLHYLNFSYTNKLCAILLHLFDPLLALYCDYRQWTLLIDYLYYSYVQNFEASEKFPIVDPTELCCFTSWPTFLQEAENIALPDDWINLIYCPQKIINIGIKP